MGEPYIEDRGKELQHLAFLRSYLSLMVDYIKSFGREQSRQHTLSHFTRLRCTELFLRVIGWYLTLAVKA